MADWIIVVDDDVNNLKMAGHILSKANMRVTALKSGQALLEQVKDKGEPDLILLDIKMPQMDGFETLERLRIWEKDNAKEEVPVIFLTADEKGETEKQGFEASASDFIRKPFDPDVLVRRVESILTKQKRISRLSQEASTDKLTGFLNKAAILDRFPGICASQAGSLLMIDLDSFKLVNDIYGHDYGDKVLIAFADIIRRYATEGSYLGRLGGDEFITFLSGRTREDDIAGFCENVNRDIVLEAKKLMGEDMNIPLGASIGAVLVPHQGNEYETLIKLADRALYNVKENGKHGYALYKSELFTEDDTNVETDLKTLSAIMGERNIPDKALCLDRDAFAYVYRFVTRYIIRKHISACKILFTLSAGEGITEEFFAERCDRFGVFVRENLRKSDVVMRSRHNQYFLFLTDIHESAIEKVIGDLVRKWHEKYGDEIVVKFETEFLGDAVNVQRNSNETRIVVVDDDVTNLKMAGNILSKGGFYVTALKSGKALLEYVETNVPSLILLDIKMPDMDGYETLKQLRTMGGEIADIPIIYLTADDSDSAENKGLSLGAMDFVKKPFVPEVLLQRVRHIIELTTLQKSLSNEVEKKTRENRELFIHVVQALAKAIDAKDTYTNGHSGRVADYAREIAKRYGYNEKKLDDIYMMGLLHDVGKIGIPDAVINKPAKLDEEEFDIIKLHPVMGAKILQRIPEMPSLATGAKWHHERYIGGGYPDGLSGNDIPEEARIIAVADAYDAMTSHRSYREALSQEQVRQEIENGRGTQFDPVFADIMLTMIKEDTHYNMREE